MALRHISFAHPLFPAEAVNLKRAHSLLDTSRLASIIKLSHEHAVGEKFSTSKRDAEEALKAYNAAVADGRYIKEFAKDPAGVANKLKVPLSAGAAAAIEKAGGIAMVGRGGGRVSDDVDVVCVAVIVVVLAGEADQPVVVDQSGRLLM